MKLTVLMGNVRKLIVSDEKNLCTYHRALASVHIQAPEEELVNYRDTRAKVTRLPLAEVNFVDSHPSSKS